MTNRTRESRRGNALVVGLMLGTLLGFSALAVDIGLIRVASTQLQAAMDASALSGVSELDGTTTGITAAKARAVQIAALNPVLDTTLAVPLADVLVGTVDDDGVWTLWDGVDPEDVNAVRVAHTPAQIGSALGGVAFGVASYAVSARSMAVREMGGGTAISTSCFLPIVVPDCWVANTPPGENPPPFRFTFSPTPSDSVGWGSPTANPSSSYIRAQIEGQCDNEPIEVGDTMYVANGQNTTALHAIKSILNDNGAIEPGTWDTSLYGPTKDRTGFEHTANTPIKSDVSFAHWGNTIEGPFALIDAGDNCGDVSFVHDAPITGIGWAVIYDVASGGTDKNVYIQMDLINDHEIWGEIGDGSGPNVLAPSDPTLVKW